MASVLYINRILLQVRVPVWHFRIHKQLRTTQLPMHTTDSDLHRTRHWVDHCVWADECGAPIRDVIGAHA